MSADPQAPTILDTGTLQFTIESRILRELGERLVKQPEVALLELVKNSYDADATACEIIYDSPEVISVSDATTAGSDGTIGIIRVLAYED